ncbi:MAG: hypothetical protein NTX27_01060, partial [Verrucomicrobia bacterium]|nr:hypothetical protein [Verrucomicrobiota bacterium]
MTSKSITIKQLHTKIALMVGLFSALAIGGCKHPATSNATGSMRNVIVASEAGKFCGWPANNGVWRWDGGREILVG